ncbi:MAG TPA: proline dehydrogenase family protein [Planctomycetota bacterium]|nr:proline dehydrogenase family protein [Planctomycetota bacterium]
MNRTLARLLTFLPKALIRRVAWRYVAGERREEVLDRIAELEADGLLGMVDLLGENARHRGEVEAVIAEYSALLADLSRRGTRGHLAVKPTHLGLRIDEELARESIARIVARAEEVDGFVEIDMEDSSTTDATLRIYRELRAAHANVGVAIQAYLRRSPEDVQALLPLRPTIRICKGIYREPASVALGGRQEIRDAYLRLVEMIIDGGGYPAIATHDTWLVDRCLELVASRGLDASRYEFQMLLGVGHALRPRILASGAKLRIYCPYGADWYDYSLRRLQENPELVGYVLRGMIRGRGGRH